MSDETIRMPQGSPWLNPTPGPGDARGPAPGPVRHAYPLAVRDHRLAVAFGLLMRSLPYALARLAIEIAFAIACVIWLVVAVGGAAWLGRHVAAVFGWTWFGVWAVGAAWFWASLLRYALYLVDCGQVAVLTELITRGQVANGGESMFAYGRRIVTARFGQVTALYGLGGLVRGIIQAFHRTLDGIAEMLPVPGLEMLSSLANMVLRAAARYLDRVVFSYNLARAEADPWTATREGLVYYCQNAKPILKTSVWIVVLERVLSLLLWLALLAPAATLVAVLPGGVREVAGLVSLLVAALFASAIRRAFIKPLFMIVMMIRFHTLIEGQPINAAWDGRLGEVSDKFRTLGARAGAAMG